MHYVALFRGINVGGKHVVKMADLRDLLTGMGFGNVQTYIQSGNVVFDSAKDIDENQIAIEFAQKFGFESDVILRTKAEMDTIVANLPFTAEEISAANAVNEAVEHLYVYFMKEAPDAGSITQLSAPHAGGDRLCCAGREVYLLTNQSIRDSKLAARMGTLNQPMTSRNWKTIIKIHDMLTQLAAK